MSGELDRTVEAIRAHRFNYANEDELQRAIAECLRRAGLEVEREAGFQHPTGLDHGWKKADDNFSRGQPNPCQCNSDADRLHWLLEC